MTAALAALVLLAVPSRAAAPARRPAPPPSIEAELSSVVDLFYDLDFDRAQKAADALEARYPGRPAGPFFRAAVAYQRWVAAGLPRDGSWTEVDRRLDEAIAEAKALEPSAPAEAHYYWGAALGFRARGLAAQKRFVRALPSAAASLRQLKLALADDPTLLDARLGLGMYHYFAARMPPAAKPFAHLLVGEAGDRERGLLELWSVARSTGPARMEARAVLSMILSKDDEADWAGADRLLSQLMTRYPHNPLYRLRRAYVAERRGRWAQAAALAAPDGGWIEALHPAIRARARAQALYRAAEIELLRRRPQEAAAFLGELDDSVLPPELRGWALLRRANLRDALGDRAGALADYRRVRGKAPLRAARAFERAPFPTGAPVIAPFFTGY